MYTLYIIIKTLPNYIKIKMKPVIGYLTNPDKVFYNILDNVLITALKKNGAKVIPMSFDDISFYISNKKNITLYKKNEKLNLDGFLSYGYMSKFHYEGYMYMISCLEKMNVKLLYSPRVQNILGNKLLQSLCYKKGGVPIPSTGVSFSIEGFKALSKLKFPKYSVLKELSDYGGDGVSVYPNKESLVNSAAKLHWKNEYSLMQKYVSDSYGKSIRVLCINNKPIAAAEYVNKANTFKSNSSFGYSNFSLVSLMNHPKRKVYEKLAIKAVNSIGKGDEMTACGVDILDSKKKGLVILEVNPWPDLFDMRETTKIDVFNLLAKGFIQKIKH